MPVSGKDLLSRRRTLWPWHVYESNFMLAGHGHRQWPSEGHSSTYAPGQPVLHRPPLATAPRCKVSVDNAASSSGKVSNADTVSTFSMVVVFNAIQNWFSFSVQRHRRPQESACGSSSFHVFPMARAGLLSKACKAEHSERKSAPGATI